MDSSRCACGVVRTLVSVCGALALQASSRGARRVHPRYPQTRFHGRAPCRKQINLWPARLCRRRRRLLQLRTRARVSRPLRRRAWGKGSSPKRHQPSRTIIMLLPWFRICAEEAVPAPTRFSCSRHLRPAATSRARARTTKFAWKMDRVPSSCWAILVAAWCRFSLWHGRHASTRLRVTVR